MYAEKPVVALKELIPGEGEMCDRIRAYPWANTQLGPPEKWPQSLHTTLSLLLHSAFPMLLFWGKDLISFYNDAFRPSLGNQGKHPSALGQKAIEMWPEIWHIIGPMFEQVLKEGKPVYYENLHVPFYRNGRLEDTFWTFSYSPVLDERKKPGGIFVTCTETTRNLEAIRQIEETKDQLQFAIEATELGTWDCNPSSERIISNERLKDWFGIPHQETLTFRDIIRCVLPADRERVESGFSAPLSHASGGGLDLEYSIIHPITNEKRVLRAKGKTYFNEDRIAYRFNGTMQDITRETEAKEALQESEARWKSLANLVPCYAFTASRDGQINYVSDKWREFTGKALSNATDSEFMDVFHPDDRRKTEVKWKNAFSKTIPLEEEVRWRRFDGQYRQMVYRIEPVEDLNGRITLWFGSAMDLTEIKRTEAALVASEQSFRNLIMKVPVGITVVSEDDFTVQMANERYLEIVDRTETELVGKPIREALPEAADLAIPLFSKVIETGEPYYGYEFPVPLKRRGKTETTYFNFIYQPVPGKVRRTTDIVVIANEVTELVRAKHALTESENQFRSLITQSPVAMAILQGQDLVIEMANKTMLKRIWGRKEEEVLGRKALEVFPELESQKYPELLARVLRDGKKYREFDSEAVIRRADGLHTFFLDIEYRPLFEADGSVSAVMISVYDVTEKVQARRKIEEVVNQLEVFKFVADNVTDFIGITDMKGTPFYVNKNGLKRVGLQSFSEVSLMDFFFPEDQRLIGETFLPRVAETGTGEVEIRFRNFETGEPIWMLYNVLLLRDATGNPYGFATISKDISVQKEWVNKLEQKVEARTLALRQANRQLRQSNQDLQQFAHVASHDLKEPVRKIRLFSGRLNDDFRDVLGEKGQGFLAKILDSTERMYAMINGVLNYSSLASADVPFVDVDLTDVLHKIENDLEVLIEEKQAVLEYPSIPSIRGIPELLYQVFYNLINNSLKFSKTGEVCRVLIEHQSIEGQDKKYHRITVRDNGIGFENSYAENIFATFTRLNSKEKYEGTGLGLSLCKKIIERHGGQISARGEKNNGAEFTILLPDQNP